MSYQVATYYGDLRISATLTRHKPPAAVCDILVEDGDIFGDGVNVAARLEGLAEPGGICVSARVREDTAGKLDLAFEDMGEQAPKEYRPTCPRLPRGDGRRRLNTGAGELGSSAPGQTVDRGAALRQYER